ncbi:hypothetical protein AAHA92_02433 [Salvia divinorum]|uniref:Uncharacterized protein n=1 Tax=Salvia divinorum TaxID=28513 RepID=A0ABD1IDY2_SALDI
MQRRGSRPPLLSLLFFSAAAARACDGSPSPLPHRGHRAAPSRRRLSRSGFATKPSKFPMGFKILLDFLVIMNSHSGNLVILEDVTSRLLKISARQLNFISIGLADKIKQEAEDNISNAFNPIIAMQSGLLRVKGKNPSSTNLSATWDYILHIGMNKNKVVFLNSNPTKFKKESEGED